MHSLSVQLLVEDIDQSFYMMLFMFILFANRELPLFKFEPRQS